MYIAQRNEGRQDWEMLVFPAGEHLVDGPQGQGQERPRECGGSTHGGRTIHPDLSGRKYPTKVAPVGVDL